MTRQWQVMDLKGNKMQTQPAIKRWIKKNDKAIDVLRNCDDSKQRADGKTKKIKTNCKNILHTQT